MSEWRKHTGTEMPSELAPAQLLLVEWPFKATPGQHIRRADELNWTTDRFSYFALIHLNGFPYVDSKGLMIWANYVAVSGDGNPRQYHYRPEWSERYTAWRPEPVHSPSTPRHPTLSACPPEFAIPGDPENSLAKVWKQQ